MFGSVSGRRMRSVSGCVFLVLSLAILGQALTPSSFFSTVDKQRLKKIFETSLKDDLPSLHYAILGLKLLGETAPNSQDLCKTLESKMSGYLANVYHAAVAGAALKCNLKPSADANTVGESTKHYLSQDFFRHFILKHRF